MEENNNVVKFEKKETRRERRARERAEAKALREEKKAAKAAEKPEKKTFKGLVKTGVEWVGDHKVAIGGAVALLVGAGVAAAKASKRCGSDEVYDPDFECEPGDEFPDTEESADESVAEE